MSNIQTTTQSCELIQSERQSDGQHQFIFTAGEKMYVITVQNGGDVLKGKSQDTSTGSEISFTNIVNYLAASPLDSRAVKRTIFNILLGEQGFSVNALASIDPEASVPTPVLGAPPAPGFGDAPASMPGINIHPTFQTAGDPQLAQSMQEQFRAEGSGWDVGAIRQAQEAMLANGQLPAEFAAAFDESDFPEHDAESANLALIARLQAEEQGVSAAPVRSTSPAIVPVSAPSPSHADGDLAAVLAASLAGLYLDDNNAVAPPAPVSVPATAPAEPELFSAHLRRMTDVHQTGRLADQFTQAEKDKFIILHDMFRQILTVADGEDVHVGMTPIARPNYPKCEQIYNILKGKLNLQEKSILDINALIEESLPALPEEQQAVRIAMQNVISNPAYRMCRETGIHIHGVLQNIVSLYEKLAELQAIEISELLSFKEVFIKRLVEQGGLCAAGVANRLFVVYVDVLHEFLTRTNVIESFNYIGEAESPMVKSTYKR